MSNQIIGFNGLPINIDALRTPSPCTFSLENVDMTNIWEYHYGARPVSWVLARLLD